MTETIGVVGAGYVGATTAAGFAHLGYRVGVVDTDPGKVSGMLVGNSGLAEPGLDDMIDRAVRTDMLTASDRYEILADATIVFVCVPTPMRSDGAADLTFIDAAVGGLRPTLRPGDIVVLKSTVPVGTGDAVAESVRDLGVHVVNNPEFLREGHTVRDFLNPDRVVVGGEAAPAARVAALYRDVEAPTSCVDRCSAELAKYACNSFLALKLSFVDELACLAERVGADIDQVTDIMGRDKRIGPEFLRPGPGWGGSCFPKDTRALASIAAAVGCSMRTLTAAIDANEAQSERIVDLVVDVVGIDGHVALWGLTFKAGTADLRESPALKIADALSKQGLRVSAHDPTVPDRTALSARLPAEFDSERAQLSLLEVLSDPCSIRPDTNAIVVTTEWEEYGSIDWFVVARRAPRVLVLDTRGVVSAQAVRAAGVRYRRIGVADG
ncbi:UDP-glucose/GDP-mannose dehydrogenase family protein [Rhodococcus fascians]|uniref:UDP-glucose dehydrogenase family protein n=1 Tax=Rhodococcoides fascians TaxID=1828 RepID=UPI00195894E6|nr:nucleotide sugar dehydrogenase [Rhodococcus fascians]MBM7241924.1 UDP-glucose/GDP-mannose dehydrogenase family protein [Rhodococcus fascians]MBY3808628.1 UDP-glucose/GDP-mannose dehydrogenase family protein [Rhodococcus fascians]MBY3840072.1 UDP-glucose/GDP-mannose dehydrogenase family protein [Rhodococcus fascians]MBY3845163.1 UDP-glucose/GDP-mannose dehydrogenase family protein [Rhodococcus fascians]MBY3848727.1 UDP-glucose/GDP-mannose dehydrogenase family protein [Rhodococcus fascians]